MKSNVKVIMIIISVFLFIENKTIAQAMTTNKVVINGMTYNLYPRIINKLPDITSPFKIKNDQEIIIGVTEDNKYALIPVTVENGKSILNENGQFNYGKANQLQVNDKDFPALAKTGLHSEKQLKKIKIITGIPISVINIKAHPGIISEAGFIAQDEDIISVLIGDNRMVNKMNLKHPELARCIFQIWNFMLQEYKSGLMGQFWNSPIKYLKFNGKKVSISGIGSRGFQESLFDDDILGNAQINVSRELDKNERTYLERKYSNLSQEKMDEMINKLSSFHTGEMVPYYIMRYGFYEGHISYRADPVSIAFIFGLKSIEEIDKAFNGKLYECLTQHHTNLL